MRHCMATKVNVHALRENCQSTVTRGNEAKLIHVTFWCHEKKYRKWKASCHRKLNQGFKASVVPRLSTFWSLVECKNRDGNTGGIEYKWYYLGRQREESPWPKQNLFFACIVCHMFCIVKSVYRYTIVSQKSAHGPSKRGVGVLSSVSAFNHERVSFWVFPHLTTKECPYCVCSYSMPSKQ